MLAYRGARFEALIEGVLMAPLDSGYTQVGFNLISVQVCEHKCNGWAITINPRECREECKER